MRSIETLVVVAVVAAVSGCTARERPSLSQRPTTTHLLSEEATGADRSVELAVQRKLRADPRLERRDIRAAATERGVVTLYGTVPTEAERVLAARLASDVSGVKRIDNEIEILVPNPDIRRENY